MHWTVLPPTAKPRRSRMHKPLTLKQAERLREQIAGVKRRLAAEKRRFGDYDDSGGYRYLPPKLYVQLGDYAGGLRYTRWFDKNFGDDIGYPDFLFEWTILLFKNGRLKEAERKAVQAYCCNTYLSELLPYSSQQPELADFAAWLRQFECTEKFAAFAARFVRLGQQLKVADGYETRRALLDERRALETGF